MASPPRAQSNGVFPPGTPGANQAVIAGKLGPAGSSAMITKVRPPIPKKDTQHESTRTRRLTPGMSSAAQLGKDTLGEGYAKNFEDVGMSLDHVSWTTEVIVYLRTIAVPALLARCSSLPHSSPPPSPRDKPPNATSPRCDTDDSHP